MKKVLALFLCIATVLFCAISANAHPGRTDSNGGHTDHSTGEYHYHHGYSAHDHYDMDGDGDIDCPYDFDDNTSMSSNNFSSIRDNLLSKYGLNGEASPETVIVTETIVETVTEEVPHIPAWAYLIIGVQAAVILSMYSIIRQKTRLLDEQKKLHENEFLQINKSLCSLDNDIAKRFGFAYIYRISKAPGGSWLDEKRMPKSPTYGNSWGDYTFYSTFAHDGRSHRKYHSEGCRYANKFSPVNAIEILKHPERYEPCKVCCPQLPDMTWTIKANEHINFFKRYAPTSIAAQSAGMHPERKFNPNPQLTSITLDNIEEQARRLGVSIDVARKLIDYERNEAGLPPLK